jgi:hypothetical protein
MVVQKPESLATADPGLATVPPEQLQLSPAEVSKTNGGKQSPLPDPANDPDRPRSEVTHAPPTPDK